MPLYSGHSRITITMAGGWWPDSRSTRPVLGTKSGMDRGLGGGGGKVPSTFFVVEYTESTIYF